MEELSRQEVVLLLVSWVLLLLGLAAGTAAAMLAFQAWQRALRQRNAQEVHQGTAFDVNQIAPRLSRLRSDYLMALHSRPHPRFHPAYLLAAAHDALKRFSYFKTGDRRLEATDRTLESREA